MPFIHVFHANCQTMQQQLAMTCIRSLYPIIDMHPIALSYYLDITAVRYQPTIIATFKKAYSILFSECYSQTTMTVLIIHKPTPICPCSVH